MTDGLRWPAALEGACYTREDGWFRNWAERGGKTWREPIPDEAISAAGIPVHPDLPDGITTLILRSQPFQNLIPRRQP